MTIQMDLLVENFPLQGMNFICTSQFPTCVTSLCTLSASSVTYQQASIWFVPEPHCTRRGSALIPFCNVQATFQIDVEHRNFLCIVEDLLLQQPLGGLPGEGKGVGGDLLQFWSWEMGRPGGGGHCGRWSRSGELGG